MCFEERLLKAHEELKSKNVSKWNYNPLFLCLLRKMGIKKRPHYYSSFLSTFLFNAILFWVLMGSFIWITYFPFEAAFIRSGIGGLFVGVFVAWYSCHKAKKLNLTSWGQLTESGK